jgi:hypothetical protein
MNPQEFYVIKDNETGEFVSDVVNDEPVFSPSESDAQWDFDEHEVSGYIDRFQIQGVKAVPGEGGNHPPKPRISA